MDSQQDKAGVRLVQTVFIAAFFAALVVPLALWNSGAGNLAAEKRVAAPWPHMPRTRAAVRAWPSDVEAFVRDRIGLRNAAVRAYNGFVFFVLRTSPVPKVVRGRDGWLFYNSIVERGELGADTIADARRSRPLPEPMADGLAGMIAERQRLVSEWKGTYLFVVVPNKSSIYSEELPPALTPVGKGKPLEQLTARLVPPPGALLDLTPAMLAGKDREEIYYRTDSHWNQLGALDGLTEIMKALKSRYPDLQLPTREDLDIQPHDWKGLDLATMLNLAPKFHETQWHIALRRPLMLPAFQRKLKVWVYRDSFYDVVPHLWSEYFPGIVVQPSYKPWIEADLRAEKPDVVIQLTAERRLRSKGPL